MSRWRSPHRLVLVLGITLLVLGAAAAAAAVLLGRSWHGPVAVLLLGGVLLVVFAAALRPRPADAPRRPAEPTWFGASTDFAGSALAQDTALPADAEPPDLAHGRPTCARCGRPMVERSGSRQRRQRWVCSDAPRCGYTLEPAAPPAQP